MTELSPFSVFLIISQCKLVNKISQEPLKLGSWFLIHRLYPTVQSRGFFTSPLTPADNFSKPPADPRTCPLSIPPRDTLIPPRIRRGPAAVPPDTCLIPLRIRGGLTMSNDDVIMIDSWDKIDLVIFTCTCMQTTTAQISMHHCVVRPSPFVISA